VSTRTRRRRNSSEPPSRAFAWTIGCSVLAVLAVMVALGYLAGNELPWKSYYTLHVRLANADNLAPHSDVRLAGSRVGQVLAVRVVNGAPQADLQLDGSLKLRTDSRFRVRPRGILGTQYIDVTPATSGTFMPSGTIVPAGRTSAATELDQAFNTLDPRTRARTVQLLDALGSGVAGRGAELNRTLGRLPGLPPLVTRSLGEVNRAGEPRRLIPAAERFAGAVAPVRTQMAADWAPEAAALAPLSRHAGQLRAALGEAVAAFGAVDSQAPAIQQFLDQTAGLAVDARAVLAPAPTSLPATTALLRIGRAPLSRLSGTLSLLHGAAPPSLSLLRSLKRDAPVLDATLAGSDPIVTELASRPCDIQGFFAGWGNNLSRGTDNTNTLRITNVSGGSGPYNASAVPPNVPSNPYPAPCVGGFESK
jgi:phospholipid/cholesterol/gamma-HCH transport system substrate-binding protein